MIENKVKFEQYKLQINSILTENEKNIRQFENQLSQDSTHSKYIVIAIITYKLKIIEILFQSHIYYYQLLDKNNESILDKIRKNLNEIIVLLKKHFTVNLDPEFSKNSKKLLNLQELTSVRMYSLLSQLDKYCTELIKLYGPYSKYTIPMAYMYGDIYGFALNNIDFQQYLVIVNDLQHKDNLITKKVLNLIIQMSDTSSRLYINSYKNANEDRLLQGAITSLSVIIKYCRLINQTDDIPNIERKIKTWERLKSS